MTPKELIKLCNKLEMSRAEIARQVKVSSKSVGNWQNGIYPIPAKVERRLLRLLKKLEEGEESVTLELPGEESSDKGWPIYLQPTGIRRLFDKYGESYAAFGRRMDTSGLTVRYWMEGKFIPSDKFHEPLRILWADTFERTPGTVTVGGKSAGISIMHAMHRQLAAEPLLELSTEFYNEYRTIRNQQDVNAVISFSAKKVGMDAEVLRQALAFVLLTLKKEMDTEAIYRCLTGHV